MGVEPIPPILQGSVAANGMEARVLSIFGANHSVTEDTEQNDQDM